MPLSLQHALVNLAPRDAGRIATEPHVRFDTVQETMHAALRCPANCISYSDGSSIDFGSQPVGTASSPSPITLTNSGTASLTVSSVTVTGANATDFAQTNNCVGTLTAANYSFTFGTSRMVTSAPRYTSHGV